MNKQASFTNGEGGFDYNLVTSVYNLVTIIDK